MNRLYSNFRQLSWVIRYREDIKYNLERRKVSCSGVIRGSRTRTGFGDKKQDEGEGEENERCTSRLRIRVGA